MLHHPNESKLWLTRWIREYFPEIVADRRHSVSIPPFPAVGSKTIHSDIPEYFDSTKLTAAFDLDP